MILIAKNKADKESKLSFEELDSYWDDLNDKEHTDKASDLVLYAKKQRALALGDKEELQRIEIIMQGSEAAESDYIRCARKLGNGDKGPYLSSHCVYSDPKSIALFMEGYKCKFDFSSLLPFEKYKPEYPVFVLPNGNLLRLSK